MTNVLTVAVIIAMLISVASIMNAYTSAIYLPFRDVGSDIVLQKSHNSTNLTSGVRLPFEKGTFNDSEIKGISTLGNVQEVSKSLVLWDFNKTGFISIEGIETNSSLGKKLGSWVDQGRFIKAGDSNKAVLESHFAKFNHLKVGNDVSLGSKTFKVVGILKIGEGSPTFSSNAYIESSDAQSISGIKEWDQLYLKVDDISNEEAVRVEISKIDPQITIISGNYISASLSNVLNIYRTFYWVGVSVMTLIAILVLFKVNAMALLERRRDIAILQTVGWTKVEIAKQILLETSLQTILGFILGAIASLAVIILLGAVSIQSMSTGLESTPTTISMPLAFPLGNAAEDLGLCIIVSLLVSYLLAKRVAMIKPSENLRSL